jgi:hexosaminidase
MVALSGSPDPPGRASRVYRHDRTRHLGGPASFAVDGSPTTRWSSLYSDPQWLRVDLGATYAVSHVRLSWETAYGRAYQIQLSPDGNTWTTIYTTSTGDGGIDEIAGLSGSGRYLRVLGTVRGTQWGYSLWSVEAYN